MATDKCADVMRTVIHADGSYAMFSDETEAANYAVQQHASLGPLMTRQHAAEVVQRTAPVGLDRMWQAGSSAWADVPNARAWVDDLRGG